MMKREKKGKEKVEENSEFEFCKICRINHNQGRRHNFFPRHTNSLSSLFGRFQKKLTDVMFALKNPSVALPPHASSNRRLWCIFCDTDIDEINSFFASGNTIKHFASEDHLKNLKHFLWKYGGGMDRVNSFRITEAEFAKWEKKCEVLKSEAEPSSKRCSGPLHGESNNIHTNYEIMNSCDENNSYFLESSLSKDVMPLQYDTNENYQVYHSDIPEAGKGGPFVHPVASSMPFASQNCLNARNLAYMNQDSRHAHLSSSTNSLADGFVGSGVHKNRSTINGKPVTEGFEKLAQISLGGPEDVKGNVHSGAPPPWLEEIEVKIHNAEPRGPKVNKNSRKTTKLNPNRVGAAWAEKRKRELELGKRGEIIASDSDPDWLPNFGRVWQSGSRKESMKEFNKEKLGVASAENQDEGAIKIRPYISKRMRRDSNEASSEGVQKSFHMSYDINQL